MRQKLKSCLLFLAGMLAAALVIFAILMIRNHAAIQHRLDLAKMAFPTEINTTEYSLDIYAQHEKNWTKGEFEGMTYYVTACPSPRLYMATKEGELLVFDFDTHQMIQYKDGKVFDRSLGSFDFRGFVEYSNFKE